MNSGKIVGSGDIALEYGQRGIAVEPALAGLISDGRIY